MTTTDNGCLTVSLSVGRVVSMLSKALKLIFFSCFSFFQMKFYFILKQVKWEKVTSFSGLKTCYVYSIDQEEHSTLFPLLFLVFPIYLKMESAGN